jgi:mannitol/fructose-specific phosphotransferase system IIA component (Ntr-type)
MVDLPALTRAHLDIAPNSRRAVIHHLARCIAADLGRPVVGILDLFDSNKVGTQATSLLNNAVLIDGYLPALEQPYFSIGRLAHPVPFSGAKELTQARLVAVLLSSEGDESAHVQRVHRLSRLLHDPSCLSGLLTATSGDAVRAIVATSPIMHRAA